MNLPFIKPVYDSLLRSKELVFSTGFARTPELHTDLPKSESVRGITGEDLSTQVMSFLSNAFSYDTTFPTYMHSSQPIVSTNMPDVAPPEQPINVVERQILRDDFVSRANIPTDIPGHSNPFVANELPTEEEEYVPFVLKSVCQQVPGGIESMTLSAQQQPIKQMPCPTTIRHLVISGGGELGFSFYSALRDSNKSGFWEIENIESIYCTSAGSIFAVLISLLLHFGWDIYDDFVLKRPWHKVFDLHFSSFTNSIHKKGVFTRETMHEIFKPIFNAIDMNVHITLKEFYEYTNIDLHIMTTELTQFELVDLSYKTHPDWELLDAVYCSAGLPLLFAPHFLENRIYLDGGFISNYPINRCLEQVENPDEILGFKRKFQNTDKPATSKINTLFDYLFYIMYTMFTKVSDLPKSVKNQVEVYSYSPTINFYKMYASFKSYDERVLLLQDGARSWTEFYEKTYCARTSIEKLEQELDTPEPTSETTFEDNPPAIVVFPE